MVDVKENKLGSTVVSSYDYSVNDLGQRTAVDTAGSALTAGERDRTWSYDALGQVTEESDANNAAFHRGFAYDAFGNVIFSSGASATSFQHRFSTKPQDAESGLALDPLTEPLWEGDPKAISNKKTRTLKATWNCCEGDSLTKIWIDGKQSTPFDNLKKGGAK